MSFATVYNTLDALAKAGLSSTLRLGQVARFDPNTTPHHHAVCDSCGEVRDVMDAGVQERAAPLPRDFRVRAVERIYRGTCALCAGREARGRKKTKKH